MVQYVSGGVDAFNTFVYAQPTQRDIDFMNQQRQSLFQNATGTVSDFFQGVKDMFQTVDYNRLKEFGKTVTERFSNFWNDNTIRPLHGITDIQFAPQNMIKYIMANPVVRTMYHANQVAGYDENYVDLEPGRVGHDHKDYRKVMHGLETYDEELDSYVFHSYDDDVENETEELEELTIVERVAILQTWENTNKFLAIGKDDPTSQYSGML